jgi:hypothetical protein
MILCDRAVSETLCLGKAVFTIVAPLGRDDLAAANAGTPFPKPLEPFSARRVPRLFWASEWMG